MKLFGAAVVLHLQELVEMSRLQLAALVGLGGDCRGCEAVIVHVYAKELALAVCIYHKLDRGDLLRVPVAHQVTAVVEIRQVRL